MKKWFVVNEFLKNPNNGERLIHDASNKRGYPDYESASEAADRINTGLKKRGLIGQAIVNKR